ncbi:hypothetical protein G6O69_11515 [Pseudenhygromyxa sp. WMMC2535]|uniref:hypothetical protein n=1 Tax=Pseudenhygromyxa sp. WMMC2535 TaxID=2712867 RepID=UPI0015960476|nr:hypothetical protein [Pseudenhygromyxa sp. WMMC2535]NVB38461.1 hypothetical protein [Pseudenhygromyxa sp. WMMC2535]
MRDTNAAVQPTSPRSQPSLALALCGVVLCATVELRPSLAHAGSPTPDAALEDSALEASEDVPASTESSEDVPTQPESSEDVPASTEPSASEPSASEPAGTEPTASAPAEPPPPGIDAPIDPPSDAAAPLGELSEQGSRRGALEFGLATVMTGAAIGLIAYASVELVRAGDRKDQCSEGGGLSSLDPCNLDPPGLGYAAAGLGYAFSVPLLVGAGLLFARGARVLTDARRWGSRLEGRQLGAAPWWSAHGGGLRLGLRF